jgi:Tetracyclin repressor-like, C-terminal domain
VLVMFEGQKPAEPRPEHAEAARRAFQTLLDAIATAQEEGSLPKGDTQRFAVVAWSGVHGLAKLAIGGQLPFKAKQTLEFADYLTQVLASGMAHTASGARRRG